MIGKCLVLALLGLAVASKDDDAGAEPQTKRALLVTGCTNQVQVGNPCRTGQVSVYYSVAGHNTMFIQCDALARAYLVQCPSGLVYNQATTSCQSPVTAHPQTGPCTAQAVTTGQIYFPYQGDNTKFYECTGVGQLQLLNCPTGLVWDTSRVACAFVPQGPITPHPNYNPGTVQFTNPCTPQQLAGNHHYFAHPDPTKFIQCDDAGQAFVVSCPSGLVWSQYSETCASAFANAVVGPSVVGPSVVG